MHIFIMYIRTYVYTSKHAKSYEKNIYQIIILFIPK